MSLIIAIVGLSTLPYTVAVFVESKCCVYDLFTSNKMHLISSLFLSSFCVSTGSFAAATALSYRTAIGVRLILKAKATARATLHFEMRTDGKSVET